LFYGLPFGEEYKGVDLEKILFEEFRQKGYHLKTVSFIFDTSKYVDLKERYWDMVS